MHSSRSGCTLLSCTSTQLLNEVVAGVPLSNCTKEILPLMVCTGYTGCAVLVWRPSWLQVKSRSSESGYGGDWAVRVRASLSPAGKARQEAAKEAAAASGTKPAKRKLALLFYFADAHWHTSELEMWPDEQASKLGEVRARWQQGQWNGPAKHDPVTTAF